MDRIALVIGSTGITGSNLTKELLKQGWSTYGLARNPHRNEAGVLPIKANLLDIANLELALQEVNPTHVFFTTWMRMESEEQNIIVNSTIVQNLLNVVSKKGTVRHVSLVTGLKHYLGPFEAYATKDSLPQTPIREDQPRLSHPNFYYAQEDEIYKAAARDSFTWSIHRPHTVIGHAIGNLMNMGTTLAVYASLCKQAQLPFVFPGSEAQWNGLSDVTDARILAEQLVWAAETPTAANKAFNIANGDLFRWSWLWKEVATWFDIPYIGYETEIKPLQNAMKDKAHLWEVLAKQHQLVEPDINQLTSAWHTDLDLGRPIEVMTDMANSRRLGFKAYYNTRDSFYQLFEKLRIDKIIP
ncbi:SDR family oxidoreductase [Sphingobacterium tabacisoli]|uniref:SDR family oxidoreductase n=1 Tax=Sphingobacterium tabacisoli TaxID=2044855 RepID=A0ABW5L099_9SPHI|nr:SDR family oxidoreductase [Sphingobacterium tabacisoli]